MTSTHRAALRSRRYLSVVLQTCTLEHSKFLRVPRGTVLHAVMQVPTVRRNKRRITEYTPGTKESPESRPRPPCHGAVCPLQARVLYFATALTPSPAGAPLPCFCTLHRALHLAASTCRVLQAPRPSHPQLISSFLLLSPFKQFFSLASRQLVFPLSSPSPVRLLLKSARLFHSLHVFDRPVHSLPAAPNSPSCLTLQKHLTQSTRLLSTVLIIFDV